jgi:hypothetical protein
MKFIVIFLRKKLRGIINYWQDFYILHFEQSGKRGGNCLVT